MSRLKEVKDHNKQLKDEQDKWNQHWRSVQEIMLPYRGRIEGDESEPNDGKERGDRRIDGTATRALRVLASGMHGGLTSPSQKWFRLSLQNTDLARFSTVRTWLDTVENVIYSNLRKSNFYQAVQNIYLETAGFGTSCLFEEEHSSGEGLWFRVITIGDFSLATDEQGRVNTVYRSDWMTAKQLVDQFGLENVSQSTKDLYDNTPYKYVKVVHAVQPRPQRDPEKKDSKNKKVESVYFEAAEPDKFLSEKGFDEFPYMCPRWDVVGSNVYGYSPGMDALPDVRSMNGIAEDLLTAVNKEIDPPVNVPESLFDDVDLLPGGRNPSTGNESVTPTYQISPNLSAGFAIKEGVKNDIADWFYTNLFVLTANPNATATEIAAKNEEQLVQLGPVIQRMFNELLNPVIERSFSILNRQGLIPEPPPEIEGGEIQIEYISTLAQAQKLVGVNKIERFTGFVGNIAGMVPEALDTVDLDALIDEYGEGIGVSAKIITSQDERDQKRQVRAQQIAQAQQQQQLAEGAQTAATLSNAKLDDKNALSEITGALENAAA